MFRRTIAWESGCEIEGSLPPGVPFWMSSLYLITADTKPTARPAQWGVHSNGGNRDQTLRCLCSLLFRAWCHWLGSRWLPTQTLKIAWVGQDLAFGFGSMNHTPGIAVDRLRGWRSYFDLSPGTRGRALAIWRRMARSRRFSSWANRSTLDLGRTLAILFRCLARTLTRSFSSAR
jgi:hypothetical protein